MIYNYEIFLLDVFGDLTENLSEFTQLLCTQISGEATKSKDSQYLR